MAAFVLERIGASAAEAVPALKKRVLEDADSICIISAAEALLRIGPKKSGVTFWKGILTHEDMSVARTAADALRRIGPAAEDAVDALFGALSSHVIHGLPQVYTFAAAALLKVAPSDPRLVGELKRGIGISNYGFQKTAIEGLVEIGSDEAYDVLRHLFDHMHAASPLTPPLERLITKVLSRVPGLKIQPRTTAPCPHCGAVLRSPRAKQCFECGADWHASSGASDRS
ncbi:MAG: hypothetical protein HQ567_11925 [Candidatus Nealsonbacteria bacterium]|nr:hypothetical protein [Candidatus Nealsonbacteria bacterium]